MTIGTGLISLPASGSGSDAAPPVLLLHGISSSFEHNWRPGGWLDLLNDEHRTVLGFDLPGHGTATATSVEHGDDVVTALLLQLEPYGPVDAVGFSAGAQLLAGTVCRDPARFRRIALLGTGDRLFESDRTGAHKLSDTILDGDEADPSARLFRRMARSAGNDVDAVARQMRVPVPTITRDGLAAFTGPALICLGERDFTMPATELASVFAHSTLKVLPGVDHFGLTSNFGCLETVLAFLSGPA